MNLFKPDAPVIPEAPKPPTTDDARQAEEDAMLLRRRRGRASTFLTGLARRSAAGQLLGNTGGAGPGTGDRKTVPTTPSRDTSL